MTTEYRWQDEALCKGATNLFTSIDKLAIAKAKAICAECPVRVPCREAGEHETGVWGGTTEEERGDARRRLRLGA